MDVCLMNGWMDTRTDYLHLQTLFTNGWKDDSILQTLVKDGYKMIEKFQFCRDRNVLFFLIFVLNTDCDAVRSLYV